MFYQNNMKANLIRLIGKFYLTHTRVGIFMHKIYGNGLIIVDVHLMNDRSRHLD